MRRAFFPPGRVPGCLPRRSKYGQICPKLEDVVDVIPRDKWPELIAEGVTLKPYVRQILDQNGVGSCATESTTQSVMVMQAWQKLPFTSLNPWSIYAFTSGGRDRGSSIDDNLQHARDVGILPESVWPRSNGWRRRPPQALLDEHARKHRIDEFVDIDSIEELGTALLKGWPVVFGWRAHSCVLLELLDRDRALYANSYGTNWGDAGFGIIPLASVNFRYGAFAVRSVINPG